MEGISRRLCLLTFHQILNHLTGIGKENTMLGHPDKVYHKGLIPQLLEHIFNSSQTLLSEGWNFKMQASMLEIYNETIRDLTNSRTYTEDVGK